MSSTDAADAREPLRDTLQAHHNSSAGVVIDSRTLVITAQRAEGRRPATAERNAP
jgi:hypothetical protein